MNFSALVIRVLEVTSERGRGSRSGDKSQAALTEGMLVIKTSTRVIVHHWFAIAGR